MSRWIPDLFLSFRVIPHYSLSRGFKWLLPAVFIQKSPLMKPLVNLVLKGKHSRSSALHVDSPNRETEFSCPTRARFCIPLDVFCDGLPGIESFGIAHM